MSNIIISTQKIYSKLDIYRYYILNYVDLVQIRVGRLKILTYQEINNSNHLKSEMEELFYERINIIKELISDESRIIVSNDFYNLIIFKEDCQYAILLQRFLPDKIEISLISKNDNNLNETTFPFKDDRIVSFEELLAILPEYASVCNLVENSGYVLK